MSFPIYKLADGSTRRLSADDAKRLGGVRVPEAKQAPAPVTKQRTPNNK